MINTERFKSTIFLYDFCLSHLIFVFFAFFFCFWMKWVIFSLCCCQAELSIALIFPLFTFTRNSLMLLFTVLDFSPILSAWHFHGSRFYISAGFVFCWPRKAMVGLYFLSKRTQSLWAKYVFREWSEIKSHTCWTQVCVWVMALYLQIVWSVAFGKSFYLS